MAALTLRGEPASPGEAIGRLWRAPSVRPDDAVAEIEEGRRPAELESALEALSAAGEELAGLAATLPPAEAGILEANVMMASDPTLTSAVAGYVIEQGLPAANSLVAAAGDQADLLASLDDPTLAARADDLRSLGRRAAASAMAGNGERPEVPDGSIVLAEDLGPGDVPEMASRAAGIALSRGGATTHAAIVARSLGVPVVCGVGDALFDAAPGTLAVLDGLRGVVTVDPGEDAVVAVKSRMETQRGASERDRLDRDLPSETRDGHPVTVLANVASPAEVGVALEYGATGAGLIRTELAFLEHAHWPTVSEHEASLRPLLAALDGRRAVVRVLDLGGDKSPPFLPAGSERGLALLLQERSHFEAQIEALLGLAREHDLRILLPLVESLGQLEEARDLISAVARRTGLPVPKVGPMVETPDAAEDAGELATISDFISIGTNDLTAATFEVDRFSESVPPPHHPVLLRHIASTVNGAHASGIQVEVCGEAASRPLMVPLLVGLGVDELSVGAARVGEVRRWVRGLRHDEIKAMAAKALEADSPEAVAALAEAPGPSANGRPVSR